MTGRERIVSLLSGQLPDRVPIFCNLLEQGAFELGLSIEEYYSSGENVAEGQLRMQERYGYDQLWGYHYAAGDAEILGSQKTIFFKDGPPNVGHLIIKRTQDIDGLFVGDSVFDRKPFKEVLKTIEILKKERGEACPVITSVLGSVSLPPLLMGMENWLDLLYTGPVEKAALLLKKCSRFTRRKTEILLESGVDLVAYFNPLGSAAFVTPGQFDKNVLPWVQSDLEGLNTGQIVYFNGGGTINSLIPSLLDNTALRAFYINPKDSIKEAKDLLSGHALLAASINDIPLISQTHREIKEEVRRIMEEGAPGGGFIFGTLVMPYSIERSKIKTMVDAAKSFGAY